MLRKLTIIVGVIALLFGCGAIDKALQGKGQALFQAAVNTAAYWYSYDRTMDDPEKMDRIMRLTESSYELAMTGTIDTQALFDLVVKEMKLVKGVGGRKEQMARQQLFTALEMDIGDGEAAWQLPDQRSAVLVLNAVPFFIQGIGDGLTDHKAKTVR